MPTSDAPPSEWRDVSRWRREQRDALVKSRLALSGECRRLRADAVREVVRHELRSRGGDLVGIYWPFKGEIDLRRTVADAGLEIALPVVVEKRAPLEFWRWRPGDELRNGVWGIPVPARRVLVRPDILCVPLVGFDAEGYRLGYGGGYYDRTLAASKEPPATIGLGFELGRLRTIWPQPHDVPMDLIITETEVREFPRAAFRSAGS